MLIQLKLLLIIFILFTITIFYPSFSYSQNTSVATENTSAATENTTPETDQKKIDSKLYKGQIDLDSLLVSENVKRVIEQLQNNGDLTSDVEKIIKLLIQQGPIKKRKIALLPFHSKTLSNSALLSLSQLFYNHLFKNNFEFISPKAVEATLQSISSENFGCYSFECSIKIGRENNYNFVVEGQIDLVEDNNYNFTIKVIQVDDGSIIYRNKKKFNIDSVEEVFFTLSKKSLQSIPIIGIVKKVNGNHFIISFGQNDGIKQGDQLLIVQFINKFDIENNLKDSVNNTIALVTVDEVARTASTSYVTHSFRKPEVNDRVIFYPNKIVQLNKVNAARKQIDNLFRNIMLVKKIEIENKEKLQNFIDKNLKKTDIKLQNKLKKLKEEQQKFFIASKKSYNKTRNLKYATYIGTALSAYSYWHLGSTDSRTQILSLVTATLYTWFLITNLDYQNMLEEGRQKKFLVNHISNHHYSQFQVSDWRQKSLLTEPRNLSFPIYHYSYQF